MWHLQHLCLTIKMQQDSTRAKFGRDKKTETAVEHLQITRTSPFRVERRLDSYQSTPFLFPKTNIQNS